MKTLLASIYTFVVIAVCGIIVTSLMGWIITLGTIPIVLLMIGVMVVLSFIVHLIDRHLLFKPYYMIRLNPTGVYCQFFLYFIAFIGGAVHVWINYWQHDGHWVLSCLLGTVIYWVLLATKGNDLVMMHKSRGIM